MQYAQFNYSIFIQLHSKKYNYLKLSSKKNWKSVISKRLHLKLWISVVNGNFFSNSKRKPPKSYVAICTLYRNEHRGLQIQMGRRGLGLTRPCYQCWVKSCSNKAPGSIPSLSYKTQNLELTYAVQVTPITNSRSVNPYESTCSICLKACRAGAKVTGSTTRDRSLPGDSPE